MRRLELAKCRTRIFELAVANSGVLVPGTRACHWARDSVRLEEIGLSRKGDHGVLAAIHPGSGAPERLPFGALLALPTSFPSGLLTEWAPNYLNTLFQRSTALTLAIPLPALKVRNFVAATGEPGSLIRVHQLFTELFTFIV